MACPSALRGGLSGQQPGMTCAFALHRRMDHPRINKVDHIGKWYVHRLRVTSPQELDDEVLGWLQEAYRLGEQRHLEASPRIDSKQ